MLSVILKPSQQLSAFFLFLFKNGLDSLEKLDKSKNGFEENDGRKGLLQCVLLAKGTLKSLRSLCNQYLAAPEFLKV